MYMIWMIKPNFGKLFSWEKLFFYEVIQDSDFLSVDLGLQEPAWCPAVVFRDNTPEPTVRGVCRYPFGSSGVLFSFISSEAYASAQLLQIFRDWRLPESPMTWEPQSRCLSRSCCGGPEDSA